MTSPMSEPIRSRWQQLYRESITESDARQCDVGSVAYICFIVGLTGRPGPQPRNGRSPFHSISSSIKGRAVTDAPLGLGSDVEILLNVTAPLFFVCLRPNCRPVS